MIEAVGYRFWPTYFHTLDRLVSPGGRVAIQAITMPHDRMLASRNTYTWIQKYIFPGGLIPSVEAVVGITERETRLRTVGMLSLRPHYAETLRLWRERFNEHREAVSALGFDDVFQRMWELYLAYSEAGFRSGYLDVYQWTFAPTGAALDELPRRLRWRRWRSWSLVYGVTFLIGRRIGRYNVVDVTWGASFVVVAAVAAVGRHRRPVPSTAAPGPGRGVGTAAGVAHGRQVGGQGRGPAVRQAAAGRLLGRQRAPQDLPDPGRRGVVHLAAAAAVRVARADAARAAARC